ncbi:MAG: inorganic phosphate transporter, PiT family, partial [Frankiales bacterium]|nr:inorganic phosphate transporter, PiT family [Frankiales bacterium]
MHVTGLVVVVLIALLFDFTNGFHDSANAIASSISTRALSPRVALAVAAIFNLLGATLFSPKVAKTIGGGIIDPGKSYHLLVVLAAALLGAIAWNLITWYFGLPSSSTHSLIGGLIGAGLASSTKVHWHVIVQ